VAEYFVKNVKILRVCILLLLYVILS